MTCQPAPPDQTADGSQAFLEQARWLLEWHHHRGEAITIRATATLGFVGVVLALFLQGASQTNFHPKWWTWVAVALGLIGLVLAGVFALLVVLPTDTQMPSVVQLRQWWSDEIERRGKESAAGQIAESILSGLDTDNDSPISEAKKGADKRACWFKCSAISLLCALLPLTGLVVDVLIRVER